jgi:hypothetical protein
MVEQIGVPNAVPVMWLDELVRPPAPVARDMMFCTEYLAAPAGRNHVGKAGLRRSLETV